MNEMKLVVGVRVLQTGFVSCETLIPAQAVLQKVGGAVGGPGFARSFVFWNTHPKKTTFSFAFSVVSVSVSHHVCIICLSTKRNIHAVLKKVYNCFTLGYRLSVPVLCSDPTRLDEPSACFDSSTEMCRHLQRILLHGPPVGYSGKKEQQKRRQYRQQKNGRKPTSFSVG